MPKRKKFSILIDVHELDSPLHKELLSLLDENCLITKGGKKAESDKNYDPCADFIVRDVNGCVWGIERKSFLDCYGSIISKRIYGQLAELQGKYPGHAIFLLECPNYFPASLRGRKWQIIRAVYTFFNERSMSMPTWIVSSPKHGADLLIRLGEGKLNIEIEGRGFKVVSD